MSETGMKWYVLRAVSGKEAKVKEYLEAAVRRDETLSANVGQILLPMEKCPVTRNGKRTIKEKVFLPGYLFIEANLQGEVAHTLRFMPNVLGFLGGLDNPTPLKQDDINRVLGTVEDAANVKDNSNVPFAANEIVKVIDGPFSGFSGVIEEVNTEKRKLKIMVKIFGRPNPLELSFTEVEKE